MSENAKVVVVGLGEVGRPILALASKHHDAFGVDISPAADPAGEVEFLHVCYPFQIQDFVLETARYIELFRPRITIINSTVAVGTTHRIAAQTGAAVVNSPVRGKHACMLDGLCRYTKFIGAIDPAAGRETAHHFQSLA